MSQEQQQQVSDEAEPTSEWVVKMVRDVPPGTKAYSFVDYEKALEVLPDFNPSEYVMEEIPPRLPKLESWACIVRRSDLPKGTMS